MVTGIWTEADIQDGPDRQDCEQDALQEAQRTGQLAEHNLTSEGRDKDQRDAVETKCIESNADRTVHACAPKTRDFPRKKDSRYRSHDGDKLPQTPRARSKTAPAPGDASPTTTPPSQRGHTGTTWQIPSFFPIAGRAFRLSESSEPA